MLSFDDIRNLYYIAPIENVPSILQKGIFSRNKAEKEHVIVSDFSDIDMQRLRSKKVVPFPENNTAVIHDYVNLYIQSKNPALYKKKDMPNLCILRISPQLLKSPMAVLCNKSACSRDAKFYPAEVGLYHLKKEVLFAPRWTDKAISAKEQKERKAERCAEVLVPDAVEPEYIEGILVPSLHLAQKVENLYQKTAKEKLPIPVSVTPTRFFHENQYDEPIPSCKARKIAQVVKNVIPKIHSSSPNSSQKMIKKTGN